MQFLHFAAATIISYLGLLAGFVLASMTREELPTATKYFTILQRLLIFIIAAIATNYLGFSLLLRILIYVVIGFLIMFKIDTRLFYALFGFLLFAVAANMNVLAITASLVFLFGLVSGSDYFARVVKRKSQVVPAARNLLLQNIACVLIALLLFALPIRFS